MSKKCKEGSSLNVDTNRCRKDCKENQERNPKTKRCRNICTDTQYRIEDKGRCRNVGKEVKAKKAKYVPQPLDEDDLAIYDYMPTLYNVSNIPDSMPFNSLPEVVESISSKKEKSMVYMVSIALSPINIPENDFMGDVPFPEAVSRSLPENYLEKLQEMLAINLQDQPVSVAIVEMEQPVLPILENTPEVKEKIFVVAITELDDYELDNFIYEDFAFQPIVKEPMSRNDFRAGLEDDEGGVNLPDTPPTRPRQTLSELMRADDKPKSNENKRVYIEDVKRAQETLKPVKPAVSPPARKRPVKKVEAFGSSYTPLPPRNPTARLLTPRTPRQTPSPRVPMTPSPRAQFPPPPTTAIPDYVRKPNRISNALLTATALLSTEATFVLNQPILEETVFKKKSKEISDDVIEKTRQEVRDKLENKLVASVYGAFGEDTVEIIPLPVSTRAVRAVPIPIDNSFGITPTVVRRIRPATALNRVVEEDSNFGITPVVGRIRPATANPSQRERQINVFNNKFNGRMSKVKSEIEKIREARGVVNNNPFGITNMSEASRDTVFSKRFYR